jgi:hypothetical protein
MHENQGEKHIIKNLSIQELNPLLRTFLQAGALSLLGRGLGNWLRLQSSTREMTTRSNGKACIINPQAPPPSTR